MSKKNIYLLKFSGLSEGVHLFDYKVDKRLFQKFDSDEIHDADLFVDIKLTKRKEMLTLEFDIKGLVELACDLCLEHFKYEIKYKTELFVEFGEENSDLSDADQNITISFNENELILDQHIYDYVNLCIPYKKVHPKDENGNSTCDPEMIKKIKEYIQEEPEKSEIDERWNKLKNLYN